MCWSKAWWWIPSKGCCQGNKYWLPSYSTYETILDITVQTWNWNFTEWLLQKTLQKSISYHQRTLFLNLFAVCCFDGQTNHNKFVCYDSYHVYPCFFLVHQMAAVAALCVQYEGDFRPNMSIVVKALNPLLHSRSGNRPSGSSASAAAAAAERSGLWFLVVYWLESLGAA